MSSLTTPAQLAAQILLDFPWMDTSAVTDPAMAQVSPNSILFWATVAFQQLNYSRWTADGDPNTTIYNLGLEMFVAHNVVLEVLAQRDMDMAGVPGVATGAIAGKSAGDVSLSYNNAATSEVNAGHWNFTIYGLRYINLARQMGAGPLQVGTPGCFGDGNDSAYSGPISTGWPWF